MGVWGLRVMGQGLTISSVNFQMSTFKLFYTAGQHIVEQLAVLIFSSNSENVSASVISQAKGEWNKNLLSEEIQFQYAREGATGPLN